MTVSVVIVSYRTGPALWDCLRAAAALPEAAELILVDNGNPADVAATLQAIAAASPRLQLITGHGNVGFARAVNLGARAAQGDTLWILNPDAVPLPGTLIRLLAHQASAPAPALIGVRILNSDGSEQRGSRRAILTPRLALIEGLRLDRLSPRWRRLNQHEDTPAAGLVPVPAISGAAMLVPRVTFLALGGLHEDYFLHVEDMDFCLAWQRAGYGTWFAGDIDLPHIGGSSATTKLRIEWLKASSFSRYFWKNFSGFATVATILSVWLRFAVLAANGLRRKGARAQVEQPHGLTPIERQVLVDALNEGTAAAR